MSKKIPPYKLITPLEQFEKTITEIHFLTPTVTFIRERAKLPTVRIEAPLPGGQTGVIEVPHYDLMIDLAIRKLGRTASGEELADHLIDAIDFDDFTEIQQHLIPFLSPSPKKST